jgi:DNA-binding response OmpR family regulator
MLDPPTILLVEDDANFAAEVSQALSARATGDWIVWHAESAADARAVLKHGRPDLIVLDLTLPDVDGLVFCSQLKTEAPNVPFMICSTVTISEKVLGFKLGAEDVLAKPFEFVELEARIEAILRRRSPPDPAGVQARSTTPPPATAAASPLGTLRVDLARWRVTLDGKPLELTPTEFQLLVFMTRRPGEIVSREELARGVWSDACMSRSRTIDAYVRRISAKLVGPGAPRMLSIRGLGYQLAVPFVTSV